LDHKSGCDFFVSDKNIDERSQRFSNSEKYFFKRRKFLFWKQKFTPFFMAISTFPLDQNFNSRLDSFFGGKKFFSPDFWCKILYVNKK